MLILDTPRLILTPKLNETLLDDVELFISQLSEIHFLANELETIENYRCFETGDDFLHQITFLGCSPTLVTDSDNLKTFISIAQHKHIQFGNSSPIPPARCPQCNKTNKNWPVYKQRWNKNFNETEYCPHCGETFNFSEMKWKKNGGFGRLFIQIHGIQEQLAVPNQTFIDKLKSLTNTDWEYFYAI